MLENIEQLEQQLSEQKTDWIKKFPAAKEEIIALKIESLCFSLPQNKVYASLIPTIDDRYWRAEFADGKCVNLGFDT